MKSFHLLLFLVTTYCIFAQPETNNWHFGQRAGIDFNSGNPVAFTNSQIFNAMGNEGCSSISDASGNLLFYTNGVNVWNKNDIVMPNGAGLLGHGSCTQSCVIVPKPGSNSIYYVFTNGADGGNANREGLNYSEVDMSLNGNLGDVTIKNVNLLGKGKTTEKLAAVKHCNNKDYWVLTHESLNNKFNAYLVTATGVNNIPVVSSLGSIPGQFDVLGYMKISPDGKKIASATFFKCMELFDFDNSTGVVSNPIVLNAPGAILNTYYGAEFSPDLSKLYVTTFGSVIWGSGQLFQFDLNAGSAAAINASAVLIANPATLTGTVQLAKDGKIYLTKSTSPFALDVINFPNSAGMACGYVANSINLAGKSSGLGLPNFVSSFFYKPPPTIPTHFSYADTCLRSITKFTIADTSNIDSVTWAFNDPSTINNTSTQLFPSHTFSSAGNYSVKLIIYYKCHNDTIIQYLNILPLPIVSVGNDVPICNSPTILSAQSSVFLNYLWTPAIGLSCNTCAVTNALPNVTTQYKLAVTDINGCSASDSIVVTVNSITTATINPIACNNISINGQHYSATGIYTQTLANANGCDSLLTIHLTINGNIYTNNNQTICQGQSILIHGINQNIPGVYTQTFVGANGCDSISQITLIVNSISTSTINVSACNNFSINGQNHSASGVYTQTLINTNGCDSLLTVNLTINNNINTNTIQTICQGQWALIHGVNENTPGVYTQTFVSVNGCDSVSQVTLTVNSITSATINITACNNTTINGQNYSASGIYTQTLTNTQGCDSLLTINLTINNTVYTNGSQSICPGQSATIHGINQTNPGIYTQTFIVANGCDSISSINLIEYSSPQAAFTVEPSPPAANTLLNFIDQSIGANSWSWNFGDVGNSSSAIQNPQFVYSDSGYYQVQLVVSNENGCSDTLVQQLYILNEFTFYVPNTFTPNGDGLNDVFIPAGIGFDHNEFEMYIYDRWGNLIYKTNKYSGWDGKANGGTDLAQIDIYVWIIRLKDQHHLKHKYLGNVNLIR